VQENASKASKIMHIVTVACLEYQWIRAFGPFDSTDDAWDWLNTTEYVKGDGFRNLIMEVEGPADALL